MRLSVANVWRRSWNRIRGRPRSSPPVRGPVAATSISVKTPKPSAEGLPHAPLGLLDAEGHLDGDGVLTDVPPTRFPFGSASGTSEVGPSLPEPAPPGGLLCRHPCQARIPRVPPGAGARGSRDPASHELPHDRSRLVEPDPIPDEQMLRRPGEVGARAQCVEDGEVSSGAPVRPPEPPGSLRRRPVERTRFRRCRQGDPPPGTSIVAREHSAIAWSGDGRDVKER